MGLTIYYRSTEPVNPTLEEVIRREAENANVGRAWVSCEPVLIFPGLEAGHLLGGSKPNFEPHPEDMAAAAREGLPDGTTRDLLDILSRISIDHGVDWEVTHDHSEAIVGYVRQGVCDEAVFAEIEMFADLAEAMSEVGDDLDEQEYVP